MKYEFPNHGKTINVTAKAIAKDGDTTTYSVTVEGKEFCKIEKTVYADRVRFAGKIYGYDKKPSGHFAITEVNGQAQRYSRYNHSSLKDAVQYAIYNCK